MEFCNVWVAHEKRITAIVPAYNEAPRIARVLEVLTTYPHFKEIIVVDDGSSDGTEEVVRRFDVRYEKNGENRGKGYAMDRGVSLATGDILFFCDADIVGLTHKNIDDIIRPVARGEVDMFIGMCNRKWYIVHQLFAVIPLLGGQRAVARHLWYRLPEYYKKYFRVEVALNFYAFYYGKGYQFKIFRKLTHIIKEKKCGFWSGTKQRWSMVYDILAAQLRLRFMHLPKLGNIFHELAYKLKNNKSKRVRAKIKQPRIT